MSLTSPNFRPFNFLCLRVEAKRSPHLGPQSHIVNARTNSSWNKTMADGSHSVIGQKYFWSKPAFLRLEKLSSRRHLEEKPKRLKTVKKEGESGHMTEYVLSLVMNSCTPGKKEFLSSCAASVDWGLSEEQAGMNRPNITSTEREATLTSHNIPTDSELYASGTLPFLVFFSGFFLMLTMFYSVWRKRHSAKTRNSVYYTKRAKPRTNFDEEEERLLEKYEDS